MDLEVNQAMVMETTQPKMKMKNVMALPNQASHLLIIPLPSFYNACLLAFNEKCILK
jgi:hypothetical protein